MGWYAFINQVTQVAILADGKIICKLSVVPEWESKIETTHILFATMRILHPKDVCCMTRQLATLQKKIGMRGYLSKVKCNFSGDCKSC
jgi:hypothetical protein